MRFEWDETKNSINKRKHGLSFAAAAEVFQDPFAVTLADPSPATEERLWTIGRLRSLVVAVIVHVDREETDEAIIRIISARKATPRERTLYEEKSQK
jgi:Uncharacterized protein conserved in bacteria